MCQVLASTRGEHAAPRHAETETTLYPVRIRLQTKASPVASRLLCDQQSVASLVRSVSALAFHCTIR
jgi:hypothetical protein